MKKIFTLDDIMVAFVSALGYGYSATLIVLLGWPGPACVALGLAIGLAFEKLISAIAFSELIQRRPVNRIIMYVSCVLIFVAAHYVSSVWMGVSMLEYLLYQYVGVVGLPILGFFLNLAIRWHRMKKIQEVYGDGSKGYVFHVEDEDIEELNQQNQPVPKRQKDDCTIRTRTGTFVGERHFGCVLYLGIPYAKAPVGELRWKAPEPLPTSADVFEAKNFGPSAIQVEHSGVILKYHRQSEDCLSLNICTGSFSFRNKRPVVVLFHHGDFTYGGATDPLVYGDRLVRNHPDVVFVSFNYRIGIFGFIDFSGVPGGEAFPDAPNLGLLDQIAALRWIKENIAAFGGDPHQITVLGFESGAVSVCLLAASQQARGLFQRAFVFEPNLQIVGNMQDAGYDQESPHTLASHLLQKTQTTSMDDLMRLDAATLRDAAQELWQDMQMPTCDGRLVPVDVYDVLRNGAASGIEFVVASPNSVRQVYRSFVGDRNYEDALSAVATIVQSHQNDSIANAPEGSSEDQTPLSEELDVRSRAFDEWNTRCILRVVDALWKGGSKLHLLYWNEKPLIEKLGSGTVDVAATLLANTDALQMYGNVLNEDMSEVLQSLLIKFIRGEALELYYNEIKGVDAIEWKAYPHVLVAAHGELHTDEL